MNFLKTVIHYKENMGRADLSFDVKKLVEDSIFSSLVQQQLSTQHKDSLLLFLNSIYSEMTMV